MHRDLFFMSAAGTSVARKANINNLPPEAWTIISGEEEGKPDVHKLYAAVPWFYSGVGLRAASLADLPYQFTNARGEEVDQPDYLEDLYRLLWLTESSLILYGKAYWYYRPSGLGTPFDVQYMAAKTIKPEYYKYGEPMPDNAQPGDVKYFERRLGGQSERLDPENVIWFWQPDPSIENGPPDASAGMAAMMSAEVLHNVDKYAAAFFERGAIKPTVMSVSGVTNKTELYRIKSRWERMTAGIKQAWNTMVFNGDSVTVATIGDGIAELSNSDLTIENRQSIYSALGIPWALIDDAANRATAEEATRNFYRLTVLPDARLIEGVINQRILFSDGLQMSFNAQALDVFQTEEAERSDAFVQYVSVGILPSTAAQMLGIELPSGMEYSELDGNLAQPETQQAAEEADAVRTATFSTDVLSEPPDVTKTSISDDLAADLNKYKRKVQKAMKRGELVTEVNFDSETIDDVIGEAVRTLLHDVLTVDDITAAFDGVKTQARYRRDLRANARALWSGEWDDVDFVNAMYQSVELGFTAAWSQALLSVGLTMNDRTADERTALARAIISEQQYIFGLAEYIEKNSRENGGKLAAVNVRVDLWVPRYTKMQAQALTMARSNPPLEWVYDPAKENCDSCLKLNGKAKRAQWWQDNNVLPAVANASYLDCKGFQCGCSLQPTTKQLSRGRMPRLP